MTNNLNKGKNCIGQTVIDSEGNQGIIIDFFIEGGKKSKVVIQYPDGTSHIREKYAVSKGTFKKPYIDDIDECLQSQNWRYIPGFNNRYIISNTGIIKSAQGINKGKILATSLDNGGYPIIGLQITEGRNNRQLCRIHRLMAITFLRELAAGEEVNHIDGNKQNNMLSNLEIVSRIDNNKKHLDLQSLGLTEQEIIKLQNLCLNQNITLKEFISQKLQGELS